MLTALGNFLFSLTTTSRNKEFFESRWNAFAKKLVLDRASCTVSFHSERGLLVRHWSHVDITYLLIGALSKILSFLTYDLLLKRHRS